MAVQRKQDPVQASGRDLRFRPVSTAAAQTLSPEQVEHYNQRGFVSPVTILPGDEADRLRVYVDELLEAVLSADDPRNSYSVNNYHVVCARLWDVVTDTRITSVVEDIIGPGMVCWGTHLFAKLPRDGKEVPFHQDAIYWPLTPSTTVTVWLAIDDADASNAAMQFVPGSHREGAIEHETLALDGSRVLGSRAGGMENRPERFVNELRAGEASLHSDLLLHGSDANGSDRRRAGLTLRYAAADVRLIDGYDDWRKFAVHVGDGDREGFWYDRRRPDGEHPERMAGFWGEFDGQPLKVG